jgi:hypothetical protein
MSSSQAYTYAVERAEVSCSRTAHFVDCPSLSAHAGRRHEGTGGAGTAHRDQSDDDHDDERGHQARALEGGRQREEGAVRHAARISMTLPPRSAALQTGRTQVEHNVVHRLAAESGIWGKASP